MIKEEHKNLSKEQIEILYADKIINEKQYISILTHNIPSIWAQTYLSNFNEVNLDGNYEKLVLRDYQTIIMDDVSNYKCLCLGRQIGKTLILCIDAIFRCENTNGNKALIVTPYKAQCQVIYDNILKFVETTPYLELESHTKNPFEIRFKNNSIIKLFSAAVSSGGEAESIRGQSASCLYIDEADYIDDKALDSIIMTTASFKNPRIWMSSTPTGRKGYFYKAFNNPEYKSFQLPSYVSPTWNKEKDQIARMSLTSAGYEHEILAEFTSNEDGVFRKPDIENCFNKKDLDGNYLTYRTLENQSYQDKYIGIDWNGSQNGVQIAVVGVNIYEKDNNTEGDITLIEKHEITGNEFQQTKAIEKIIEINRRINPKYIYADQGFGSMQIELMHRYGVLHPNTGLTEKLKGIDFSGTTEIFDPITNQHVKKRNKHLMVDNLCRLMEKNIITIPQDELGENNLEYALINYSIVRWSTNGMPVYECIGTPDHFFDAFLLACNAFYLGDGKFNDPSSLINVAKPKLINTSNFTNAIDKNISKIVMQKGIKSRRYDEIDNNENNTISSNIDLNKNKTNFSGSIEQGMLYYANKIKNNSSRFSGRKKFSRQGSRVSYE